MVYNSTVKRLVLDLYGVNSDIYKTLINGEKISRLVKYSYKNKSINRYRIGDKKKLFEMCRQLEENFEKSDDQNVGL